MALRSAVIVNTILTCYANNNEKTFEKTALNQIMNGKGGERP